MHTNDQAPRKVAYILKMFPRFSETFILSEILELERQGQEVEIHSLKLPADDRVHADVALVQAPVTYLPPLSVRRGGQYLAAHVLTATRHPWRYVRTVWNTLRRHSWGATKRFLQAGYIARQLDQSGIVHIHAHFASSATSVAHHIHSLTGIGYSFTAHAKDIYIDGVNPEVLQRKLDAARFVVTVSDFNEAHLRSISPAAPIHRIYNGLDLQQFHPNGTRPDPVPLVLAVGRLVEKKGIRDLIDACAILRDRGITFRCAIVGSGSEELELRMRIASLRLEPFVELPGPMPREDLVKLYPRASVVVAPCVIGSDGNRDGLPTVLIEAMALGVPVISTAVTGIPELVQHGVTGNIAAQGDPNDLANAIEDALTNRTEAQTWAAAGRRLIEQRFDLRENVASLKALLEKASA
jgi:glycosyltransferase involved in cell wall biosynthesis